MEKLELLFFTAVRRLNETTTVTNYDDLFILQRAADMGGVVISNDRYEEILNDPTYSALRSDLSYSLL